MFNLHINCNIDSYSKVMTKPKIKPLDSEKDIGENSKNLILFNDNINTFNFVITNLIEVCHHDPQQAEQCALTAHYKGKCIVKTGEFEVLKPMSEELSVRNLTVKIE